MDPVTPPPLPSGCTPRIPPLFSLSPLLPPLRLSPKKTSSGAFTRDSRHVVWGDKYGDVLIGACSSRNDPAKPQRPALLLGHLCSVVAALSVSPDNRCVGG